jgi:hypothetical protein
MSDTETPKETAQETLQRLENEYVKAEGVVQDLQGQLATLRDKLISAQSASTKALLASTNAKEQYLINVINAQQTELKKLKGAEAPRADNV